MVNLRDIKVEFGGTPLFQDLSLQINDGDRIGLVGANGVGKTTLLKIICGLATPTEGEVEVSKFSTFGYLPQEGVIFSGRTLWEEMMSVFHTITELFKEREKIEKELCKNSKIERLLKRYGNIESKIQQLNGYTVENRIEKILTGLGFKEIDYKKNVETFSGGWEMRIALGKLLLSEPNCLLLDEPTNYLDIESITWFENWLDNFAGTIVMVSHDRYFMDRIVKKIAELESGVLTLYHTNFAGYTEEKKKRRELLLKAYTNQQKEIARIQSFIAKSRANVKKAKIVKSREKLLNRMERIVIPPTPKKVRFEFSTIPHYGKKVMELKGISKSYGNKRVLSNIDLLIGRGEKIAVVGVNGAGKTTLLKIMAGVLHPDGGERWVSQRTHRGYFAQRTLEMLNPQNTVLGELAESYPDETPGRLRNLLGMFLFSEDDVFKPVSVLSGGEKTRLAIAKTLLHPSNLLILDEPTNHLDLQGREVLEKVLKNYDGTIIFVTHDRYIIDRIASKIVELSDHKFKIYHGNYTDYLSKKSQVPKPRQKKVKRKTLNEIEKLIEEKENRISELGAMLSELSLHSKRVKGCVAERKSLQKKVEKLWKEWEEIVQVKETS